MKETQGRRLIAVDCDGTLFDDDGYPSQRTYEVIQRVLDSGHPIVAVTGRSRFTACDRLEAVPGMRHLVCSNGAYAWDMREDLLVWETEITPIQVAEIVRLLRHEYSDLSFSWETRGGLGYEDTFVELAGGIDEVENGGCAGDLWSQGLYKLKVRRPGMYCVELHHEVAAILGESLCEITTSGAPFIELAAPGSSKASGLEKTAVSLGFKAEDTIVFGDNYNDLSMFRWAGHAVAMGNALDEIQAEAHAVTLSNTEHGVAHYLEKLLDAGEL